MSRVLLSLVADDDQQRRQHTAEGAQRLATFSDGVVAIAITLVVLPLVDLVSGRFASIETLLGADRSRLAAAALSFVVIGSLWREHHATFEHADRWTNRLVTTNFIWLGAIVFLPVPTALLLAPGSAVETGAGAAVYAGTMAVAQLSMRLMSIEVARRCVEHPPQAPSMMLWALQWTSPALMVGVSIASVSGFGARSLWLLLLTVPLQWVTLAVQHHDRRRARSVHR